MKTIIRILLLITASLVALSARSQVFVTVDPSFFKVGAMYNYRLEKIGFYGRGEYGDVVEQDFYTENVKIGTGVSLRTREGAQFFLGLNYNHFFHTVDNSLAVNIAMVSPVSFECGVAAKFGRITMLIMTDPVNWESCVGISFSLTKTRRQPQYGCR